MALLGDLADAGFELAASLPRVTAAALDPAVATLLAAAQPGAHALVVGNTAALWPRFLDAYRREPALRAHADPFDAFVEARLTAAAGARTIGFAHAPVAGGFLPMQRLAVAARLGWIGRHHLVVHPRFGPWWSLRALVALDPSDPEVAGPAAPGAGCDPGACAARCTAAAVAAARPDATWRDHLAARRACQVGATHAYGEAQARYHHAHDREVLAAAWRLPR